MQRTVLPARMYVCSLSALVWINSICGVTVMTDDDDDDDDNATDSLFLSAERLVLILSPSFR